MPVQKRDLGVWVPFGPCAVALFANPHVRCRRSTPHEMTFVRSVQKFARTTAKSLENGEAVRRRRSGKPRQPRHEALQPH